MSNESSTSAACECGDGRCRRLSNCKREQEPLPPLPATFCRHCLYEIESYNGYDYVTRGVSWRHVATSSAWCRTTVAEPSPPHAPCDGGLTCRIAGCQGVTVDA